MTEVVKQEVPEEESTWVPKWQDVMKASGREVPQEPEEDGIVLRTVKSMAPWLMGGEAIQKIAQEQRRKREEAAKPVAKPFDMDIYLPKLVTAESSGRNSIKAETSTATGPHQFTAPTWLDMVDKLGLPYTLADRTDPKKSTIVAKEFTKANVEKAKKDLGREPSMVEVYLYHFIAKSAPKLIKAPPDKPAKDYVTPAQAKANYNVFYDKQGKPLTVGDVINRFRKKF